MEKKESIYRLFTALALLFAFAILNLSPGASLETKIAPLNKPKELPKVGSLKRLKKILSKISKQRWQGRLPYSRRYLANDVYTYQTASPLFKSESNIGAERPDFSKTNVQVSGVDEADTIKTDGKYIYQIGDRRVIIVKAHPATDLKVVHQIKFDDEYFEPMELYVDKKFLVVIGSSYIKVEKQSYNNGKFTYLKRYPDASQVEVVIFDISNPKAPRKIRQLEVEGTYISSRKINSSLYFIANKYNNVYRIMKGDQNPQTPLYRDTAGNGKYQNVSYADISYFPGSQEPNYLIISSINLDQPDKEVKVNTYLGAGENVYASTENLYIVATNYRVQQPTKLKREGLIRPLPTVEGTTIYKFALNNGEVIYQAKGRVQGGVLNQFSMDENNGYFRIATTEKRFSSSGANNSKNNIYVLNQNLEIIGKQEDIAPGEQIYSVRFIGDRGYLVTFKKVDPFFVIDLKNPAAPKILGYLKIPGYSDYLHPYDANHIIGFGKDTVEAKTGDFAWYQGMKVAIFDVSDVTHPVEEFKTVIGDRGTNSPLLQDHKALLFNREKGLLAFPVNVMKIKKKFNLPQESWPRYGSFEWQGVYVYNVNLKDGFKLRGKITHLNQGSQEISRFVNRALYINDTLYTSSMSMIKANKLSNLKEIKAISF